MERVAFGRRIASAINMVSGVTLIETQTDTGSLCSAAMPSLHFGYSLMIGLTIMTIPLTPQPRRTVLRSRLTRSLRLTVPSWRRLGCLTLGFLYPFTILVAIVATANHFILDAVAGALVCALGWSFNGALLNLLPLEDYFLYLIRIHKPEPSLDMPSESRTPSENGAECTNS